MSCGSCGAALKPGARFCGRCGASVSQPGQTPRQEKKICPRCGADNPVAAKFCQADGYPFVEQSEPSTATAKSSPPGVNRQAANGGDAAGVGARSVRCPACGAENPPDAEFCKKDGVPLAATGKREVKPSNLSAPSPSSRKAASSHEAPRASGLTAASPLRPGAGREDSTPKTQRNRTPLLIGAGVLATVLTAGAAGYGYWAGYIGDRPGSIARQLTADLKQQGLGEVVVTMGKDWVAVAKGNVVGQDQRTMVEQAIVRRKEAKGANLDALVVRPSTAEIRAALEKKYSEQRLSHLELNVADGGIVTLSGRAKSDSEINRAIRSAETVDGVEAVNNQIRRPLSALESEINQALRSKGYRRIRARVKSLDVIEVSGVEAVF